MQEPSHDIKLSVHKPTPSSGTGWTQVVGAGKHVLGYVVMGPMALLLLVEKTRTSATLPGGHQIKTLVTTRWHKIPLQVCILSRWACDEGGFQQHRPHILYLCKASDVLNSADKKQLPLRHLSQISGTALYAAIVLYSCHVSVPFAPCCVAVAAAASRPVASSRYDP